MAALALATESPSSSVLDRMPRGRDAPLINRRMWTNIVGQSLYQIGLQLWVLNFGYKYFGVEREGKEHLTIVFNIFVLLQVVNEFNARILGGKINVFSGLHRAQMFLFIILVTVVVQVIGVTYAGAFMHTVPLNLEQWKKCMYFSIVPFFWGFVLRMIPVREAQSSVKDFVRRNEDGEPIVDESEGEEVDTAPKMTFQRAGYAVIAQLKVVGALAEAVSLKNGPSRAAESN
eukprot:GDKK01004744.1.p1 GENE.GDKK01004744.1~~GDKK01004744.1.p1  ORF type:complete len:251 (+),score=28.55 GDKK01004744.1:62-754(+)